MKPEASALNHPPAHAARNVPLSLWSIPLVALAAGCFLVIPGAAAVHDLGIFELDGNAVTTVGGSTPDWDKFFPVDASTHAFRKHFASEPRGLDTTYATGGSTKDEKDLDAWRHTSAAEYPPKNELTNVYAVGLEHDGKRRIYFGADRWAGGESSVGFWFFQQRVTLNDDGTFNGLHAVGDLFVVADFTNGGRVSTMNVYKWVGGTNPLALLTTGSDCRDAAAGDTACARVNDVAVASPWPYVPNTGAADVFPATAFFEAGIDLATMGGGNFPCYFSMISETRSSTQLTATLRDFALSAFSTCYPDLSVTLDASETSVAVGSDITWTATVKNHGDAPADVAALVGQTPTGLVATSATVTGLAADACSVSALGEITCNLGRLAPGATRTVVIVARTTTLGCGAVSQSVTASTAEEPSIRLSDNTARASSRVVCADVSLSSTGGLTVQGTSGSQLQLPFSIESKGPDAATGVAFTLALPTLPAGTVWTYVADDDASCSVSELSVLSCTWRQLASGQTRQVTLTRDLVGEECGTFELTGTVGADVDTNALNNEAQAKANVTCPEPAPPAVCPHSQGYWKNHAGAWPVDSLVIGGKTYGKSKLLEIFNTAPKGDATYILAHQLIAAKLNVANGADGSTVASAIAEADNLLATHGLGTKVKTTSAHGSRMVELASALDAYNNGAGVPGCA